MRVVVKSTFVDKCTKGKHELNEELEISKERYKELKEFVEIKDKNEEVENK